LFHSNRCLDYNKHSYDSYYSALLYFTGSAELNRKMRQIAKSMKLKLSEYGLTKENGTRLPITSEYDFFKILKIEYLPPNLR
jgi:DNA polymerase/3'-5' exonuclease PolX